MTDDARKRLVLVATVLGSSMAFLDAFVVNVALPTIDEELGLGLTGEQWMFLSYSLALAALYLPAGALGDRYGYANTFVIGVAGFAAASVLAGVAPTSEVLIAARAIQGIFGALLTPGSLALLRATYRGRGRPGHRRLDGLDERSHRRRSRRRGSRRRGGVLARDLPAQHSRRGRDDRRRARLA